MKSIEEINQIILKFLNELPDVTNKEFEKLNSDEEVFNFINKTIGRVYSELSKVDSFRSEINYELVKNQLVLYLVSKINTTRASYEKIDYDSITSFITALKISSSIKNIYPAKITPEITTLSQKDAKIFLKNYENRIEVLKRMISRAKKNYNDTLVEQKKEELKEYEHAIEQMNKEQSFVTIIFSTVLFFSRTIRGTDCNN